MVSEIWIWSVTLIVNESVNVIVSDCVCGGDDEVMLISIDCDESDEVLGCHALNDECGWTVRP